MLIPKNLTVFEKSKALLMSIVEGPSGKPILNIIKGWKVLSFEENLMKIKLFVEDPYSLSLSRVRLSNY